MGNSASLDELTNISIHAPREGRDTTIAVVCTTYQ